jgi:hypothetical protein
METYHVLTDDGLFRVLSLSATTIPTTPVSAMATTTPTTTPGREALEQFLPYVNTGISALSTAFSAAVYLTHKFTSLVFSKFSPLPIIFYLMAPLFVFIETLVDIFVHVPYEIAMNLLDTFYPIYVFCGVACITGGLLGLTGRIISSILVHLLEEPEPYGKKALEERRAAKGKSKA